MTEKDKKNPEQQAAEKLAKIHWDGKKTDLTANYGSLRVLGEMAEKSVKDGTDPIQDKDFSKNYADALIKNHTSTYGLDKVDNAGYYLETGHGWNKDVIEKTLNQAIQKTGSISGGAVDAITQSEARQKAMQTFSQYHLRENMPSEEEVAQAANYIGLGKVVDKDQVKRMGGFKGLAGLVTGLSEQHKNGNINEESLVGTLATNKLDYLINNKVHDKYFGKSE